MWLQIWDVREGRLLFTCVCHTGGVTDARFSPCGKYFASGGLDALVMIWKADLSNTNQITSALSTDNVARSPSEVFLGASRGAPRGAPRGARERGASPIKRPVVAADVSLGRTSTPSTRPRMRFLGPASDAESENRPNDANTEPSSRVRTVQNNSELLERTELPAALAGTLDHIVGQVLRALLRYISRQCAASD
jgi:WD40 repeat protein